jgi:hypothetical protein
MAAASFSITLIDLDAVIARLPLHVVPSTWRGARACRYPDIAFPFARAASAGDNWPIRPRGKHRRDKHRELG